MTGGYFHKLLQFLQPSCIALASLATVNGACVAGCGPRKAADFWGLGLGVQGAWGGAPGLGVLLRAAAPGRRGGRGGGPLGARSLPWKCCWHRHFPSSLSLALSIHSPARVYGRGGELPLAPVLSVNKKEIGPEKGRVCRLRGTETKTQGEGAAAFPKAFWGARPPRSPARQPAQSQAFIYLFFWLKKKKKEKNSESSLILAPPPPSPPPNVLGGHCQMDPGGSPE